MKDSDRPPLPASWLLVFQFLFWPSLAKGSGMEAEDGRMEPNVPRFKFATLSRIHVSSFKPAPGRVLIDPQS